MFYKIVLGLCLSVTFLSLALGNDAVEKIQDFSVTIKSGNSEGSGSIISREIFKTDARKEKVVVNFILTAGHIVDDLRNVRTVIEKGRDKKIVEFKDAFMVREELQDGRRVGESKMDCKVLRYSDPDNGEDLALLMVIKQGYRSKDVSARFYLEEKLVPVGTQLWHCGSLNGQMGANSITNGIMSQIGRVYKGKVYDQTTVTAFPGSSGGGVFIIKGGKPLYIGMVVRGSGETFNLLVSMRRILKWAKESNLEWIFDEGVEPPTLDKIKKISVEGPSDIKDDKVKEPTPAIPNDEQNFIFMDGEHAKDFYKNTKMVERKKNY